MPRGQQILPPLEKDNPGAGDQPLQHGCNKAEMYQRRIAAGGMNDEWNWTYRDALQDTDIIDNNFDVEVDPVASTISGSNTMTLRSTVNGLTQFTFMLRTNGGAITNGYTQGTVVINGTTTLPASAVTVVGTYGRRITLDRTYNAGEQFTVKVNYSGTPRNVGLGSFAIGPTALNGLPFAASLAEPYYAASVWPIKDGENGQVGDNSDKSTGTVSVTSASTNRSVGNGLLVSTVPLTGGKTKYTWRTNLPTAPYLFFFATHPYNVYQATYTYPLTGGGTATMPFEIDISPGSDTAANRAVWQQSLQMLETLRPLYGLYPFVSEKYGVYQFTFGGGQEHQTFTGMGGGFFESVTVHELGHQWWGDNITCKFWNDIWLNEGFATYTEALWEEHKPGSTGLPALYSAMAARRPNAATLTGTTNCSVYCYDVTNPNIIFNSNTSYDKGGWALHTLRKYVGDTTFFQILANYRATYQGGGATTQQFADVASATYGSSLQGYFDSFVFGQGAPVYAYGTQTATINGRTYLKLHLRQTQNTAMGATGGKFVTPIDVKVTTPAGTTTYVVLNDEREEDFVIPTNGLASAVVLDENNWILNNGKTSETYIPSPPKLLTATPAPSGTVTASSAPVTVALTFSENITASAGQFSLVGPAGTVPLTYAYNAATNTVTLGAGVLMLPGTYTVTVQDTVTGNGLRLDGEISGNALPSGDGKPNGNVVYTFTVAPCAADINLDGTVDFFDYLDFVDRFSANDVRADFNHDNSIDFFDYLDFVNAFSTPC